MLIQIYGCWGMHMAPGQHQLHGLVSAEVADVKELGMLRDKDLNVVRFKNVVVDRDSMAALALGRKDALALRD
jgi:hypothetical protein